MSGRLTLSQSVIVGSLIGEMTDALSAMEAGDYDKAFAILEARARPADAMQRPPRCFSLPAARIAERMLALAPAGILRTEHDLFVGNAAAVIAQVVDRSTAAVDIDRLAVAANFAEDCGLSLQWEADDEDEPG